MVDMHENMDDLRSSCVAQSDCGCGDYCGGGEDVSVKKPPKILVIGDYLLDNYWLATADRVSPEAPIPVGKVYKRFTLEGGAGNVVSNFEALGGKAGLIASSFGVPEKNRLMIGDVQIARWDENDKCEGIPVCKIHSWLLMFGPVDAVVVADYCKGSIAPEVIEAIKALNLPTFVDTKGDPSVWIPWAMLFPNLKEYEQYKQYEACDARIVVKFGKKGIREQTRLSIYGLPAWARFVRSVNGAGDTVLAAYVYATLTHEPDPLAFANAAAANVVEKPYTAPTTKEEIYETLRRVQKG